MERRDVVSPLGTIVNKDLSTDSVDVYAGDPPIFSDAWFESFNLLWEDPGSTSTEELPSCLELEQARLGSFTMFHKLPPELRQMIWTHACSEPRVVDLWQVSFSDHTNNNDYLPWPYTWKDEPYTWTSHSQAPTILSVCKEARTVALRHYELCCGTEFSGYGPFKITTPATIWINWERDLVMLGNTEFFDWKLLRKYAAKARRIALPCITDYDSGPAGSNFLFRNSRPCWAQLEHLSEIVLYNVSRIYGYEDISWYRYLRLRFTTSDEDVQNKEGLSISKTGVHLWGRGINTTTPSAVRERLMQELAVDLAEYANENFPDGGWKLQMLCFKDLRIEKDFEKSGC